MCSLILQLALWTSAFTNPYNHTVNESVKRLKVCGERCSGTNFVMYLLHKNFPTLAPTAIREFGHKHYLWWFDIPISKNTLNKLRYTQEDVSLINSQDCLFVVVVRDSYDWLRSFYLKPYDVHKTRCTRGFYQFLKRKWKLTRHYRPGSGQHDEVDNQNPWTGKPFANVLELRKYKIVNYLRLGTLVDNFLLVRYEDVRDNPQAFIDFVARFYNLAKAESFDPVDIVIDTSIPPTQARSGPSEPFVRNPYFPFSQRELKFINQHTDWPTENLIGYLPRP